jgi:hypothetical protein
LELEFKLLTAELRSDEALRVQAAARPVAARPSVVGGAVPHTCGGCRAGGDGIGLSAGCYQATVNRGLPFVATFMVET